MNFGKLDLSLIGLRRDVNINYFVFIAAEPPKKKVKPFNQMMKKVVFCLSGYQNPERGKIRDRALEMGADYKPDWGRGCTHLV